MQKQPFRGPIRRLLQSATFVVAVGLLAIPPIAVALSGSASADALWTTLRIAALEAFTIIFVNIVTGSFRPFFNRLAKPRLVQRIHTVTGIVGFSVAVAHGLCALAFGTTGYRPGAIWIGPVALVILAVVIDTAILRTRFRRSWRWIHRLNYLIFVAVLVHGLALGTDLRSSLFLKICAGIYMAVVVAGFVSRSRSARSTASR
jgi:DMSO/TMAO reductase YedYZ heme-binding membrane subunit